MSALIYLCDRCLEEVIDMRLPGDKGSFHAPLIWNVADDDAISTLESVADGRVSWGMLFWLPLMRGADDDNFVRRWREVVVAKIESRIRRTELAIIAIVFAELANRRPIWERGLEGFEQMESQVVNDWLRKGGKFGRIEEAREALLDGLEVKFSGVAPPDIITLINTQESLPVLRDWRRELFRVTTYDEFLAVLKR